MKKLFKLFGWAIGVLVLMIAVFAVALPIFFDPNDYKDQISDLVKDKTGRHLDLAGDLKLSVFPWLGVDAGAVSISNPPDFGKAAMLSIKNLNVKVKLLPLLSKEVVLDTVVLEEPQLHLITDEVGKTNWQDLASDAGSGAESGDAKDAGIALAALAVQGVKLVDGRVTWEDRRAKSAYTVDKVNVTTGSVLSGRPVKVDIGFDVNDGRLPSPVSVDLGGVIDLDPGGRVAVTEMALEARSTGASTHVKVPRATFDQRSSELHVKGMTLTLDTGTVRTTANAPNVSLNLDQQTLDVPELRAVSGGVEAQVRLAGTKVLDAPSFEGEFTAAPFDLRTFLKSLEVTFDSADPSTLKNVALTSSFFATTDSLQVKNLDVTFDDTKVTGSVDVANFISPHYRFDLIVDRIDLDRYLPPPSEQSTAGANSQAQAGAAFVLPLALFRGLEADGNLSVGEVKASGVTVSNVRIGVNSEGGEVNVKPLDANLYGGKLLGSMRFTEGDQAATLEIKEDMVNVSMGPLLTATQVTENVKGTGDLNLALEGREAGGRQNLNGTARFHFRDGAVKGLNIRRIIQQAKAIRDRLEGREPLVEMEGSDEFQFTEMTGTLKLTERTAVNEDLSIKSSLFRITGNGQADLANDSLDYLLEVAVVQSSKGQGGKDLEELAGWTIPVRVSGSLGAPKYKIDAQALLTTALQKEVDADKDEIKKKLADKLEEKLGDKGLDEELREKLNKKLDNFFK